MANGKMNSLGELRVRLSPLMLFILLFILGLGLNYLIPYHDAAKFCGPSAYLAVLVALLLLLPFIFLISALQHRFPEKNILGAAVETYGGLFGTLFNLFFLAALTLQVILVVRNSAELIITHSLNRTPLWAVVALILICSGFFVKDGLTGVGRLAGFVFIPVFLFRILMLCFATQGMEFSYLLPVISAGPLDYLKGGLSLVVFFYPSVTGLLFIYPLLSKPGKLKLVSGSLLLVQTVIIFVSVAIVTGVFGAAGLQAFIWPVFETIRRIDITFLALDQIGIIFLILWFTAFLAGISLMLYISGSGIKEQFKKFDYRWCLLGSIILVGIGAVLIPNLFYDIKAFMFVCNSAIAYIYAYPLLVYVGALIRGVGIKSK